LEGLIRIYIFSNFHNYFAADEYLFRFLGGKFLKIKKIKIKKIKNKFLEIKSSFFLRAV
tara:strand:- start:109 stop:285 length:177 start_codon:yes stop_codon:yes gene_type:complete